MDADRGRPTLPEELLLLGWNDEAGKNRHTQNLAALLAGALILELVVREVAVVDGDRLHPTGEQTGVPLLDQALADVGGRSPRKVQSWVGRWGGRSWVRKTTLAHLADRGILRTDERRALGIGYTRHPVADAAAVAELRRRISDVLLTTEPVGDARDAALGGLVSSAGNGLVKALVPGDRRRQARDRAKALARGDGVSTDIAKAIAAANAAAMVAVMGAVATSSASSSSSS